MFPYVFDYLQELPTPTGGYLELLTLSASESNLPSKQSLENHVRRLTKIREDDNLRVTLIGLGDIRAEHLTQ